MNCVCYAGCVLLTALLASASLTVAEPEPSVVLFAADDGSITATVEGLRNSRGKALFHLFSEGKAFPGKPSKAVRRGRGTIESGRASVRWEDVPAGVYAISVVHDENGNGKLDTNLIGMPKEGVGASNDAKSKTGPPKWAQAKFEHAGSTRQVMKITYLL